MSPLSDFNITVPSTRFSFTETVFPIIFGIVAIVVVSIFVYAFVHEIKTRNKNNNSPKVSAHAKVATKRSSNYSDGASYYITFEFDTSDRLELYVSYKEYGMVADSDTGTLIFQGTRFISFERE